MHHAGLTHRRTGPSARALLRLAQADLRELRVAVKEHVGLTLAHGNVLRAADTLARLLFRIREGLALHDPIRREAGDWISGNKAD